MVVPLAASTVVYLAGWKVALMDYWKAAYSVDYLDNLLAASMVDMRADYLVD